MSSFQNSADIFSSFLTATGCGLNNKELINSLPQSVGLLEVLPLNFKHFSCSNGTQMEKANNGGKQETNLYVLPDFFSVFENTNNEKDKSQMSSPTDNQVN